MPSGITDFVAPDFNPGSRWAMLRQVPYGTDDLLGGSDGFDAHTIRTKLPLPHLVRWIVPPALKGKWGRFNPGLKSGATKSAIRKRIFKLVGMNKCNNGMGNNCLKFISNVSPRPLPTAKKNAVRRGASVYE